MYNKSVVISKDYPESPVCDEFAGKVKESLAYLGERLYAVNCKLTEISGNLPSTSSDEKRPEPSCLIEDIISRIICLHRVVDEIEVKLNRVM